MFKKIVQKGLIMIALISDAISSQKAIEQFEEAWKNPYYTQIQLENVDVNKVLNTYYEASDHIQFTREMLWDVERKKAWEPEIYISNVVSEGKSWGRMTLDIGDEQFTRMTKQRQWLTDHYMPVIEEVSLLNKQQKAIFIGLSRAKDEKNKDMSIDIINTQPLFYVEHGVAGTEDQPKNTWRIVHLTAEKDINLIKRFEIFKDSTALPKYIEVYIERDLGISLKKKDLHK